MGEAQMATRRLPPEWQLHYIAVWKAMQRAMLECIGESPEEHQQQFHSMVLREEDQLLTNGQHLLDSCKCWMQLDPVHLEKVIEQVALKAQFTAQLLAGTSNLVQWH